MPAYVAAFLDLDKRVGRKFREETINDLLVAAILQLPQHEIFVATPPEIKTGGDFDIIIVDENIADAVQYRVQAKKLSVNEKNWQFSNYKELCHPDNTGEQSKTLIRSSVHEFIHTIPLYGFYNPARVCAQSPDDISGVQLADGYEIRRLVSKIVAINAMGGKTTLRRIEHLRQFFMPLSTILCPPTEFTDRTVVPHPSVSRRTVEAALRRGRDQRRDYFWDELPMIGGKVVERLADRRSPPPERGSIIPQWLRKVAESRREERLVVTSLVKRPKVILTGGGAA